MKQQYKSLAFGLAALCALGAAAWGLLASHASATDAPEAAPASLVHDGARIVVPEQSPLRKSLAIAAIGEQTVSVPFTLPAVIEADQARLVKIQTPLSGRIVTLNKQLGDPVKAGELLLTIDSADLAQASADAAKARAALALAKRNLTRQRELDIADIGAKRDLEQAQSDFEQAASEAARADARLSQLGAKAGGTVGHLLAVRSPISGRVVELAAAAGGYWNDATAPLMTVADLSQVYVSANAQEKDLGQVFVGQSAAVRFDAYPDSLNAKVRYVGELLDVDTRTVKVRMALDNTAGRLKPGMFAQATLLAPAHTGITVPMTAVILSGFTNRVFVEVAPWQFEARAVTLGPQVGEHTEVVAGLKAGERVVVKNGVLLND
ncbi:efflux RND transporter periplasmic adaptor subunit [Massilia horti]|uniref:Efflux RND transporter periplasmic adaptor subunit n=1 Tax=Massilia horti TaxID=2562153 RepID=A0A4Y9T541_9BURK|nr:efflux RND transporter periplasmic adaptor subunit [Massilia horti]TFW32232.1 efflux RND transporter periplasmic adaptor subunit [Massilia horti]